MSTKVDRRFFGMIKLFGLLVVATCGLLAQFTAQAATLSTGQDYSLQIRGDGNIYAWGFNSVGQLGDGTTTTRPTPVVITLSSGVTATAVSAGVTHSLARGSNGNLYAWGSNTAGQLGDGTTMNHYKPGLVKPPAGVTFTVFEAGNSFSLALGSDGKLYSWGYNYVGQRGVGTANWNPNPTPGLVSLPAGVTATVFSVGNLHSLALGSDGKLYSWGYNGSGQLGDGTSTNRWTPVQVNLPAGVTTTKFIAGNHHSLALGSDGKLYSWGSNGSGQLGDGTTTSRLTPVRVNLPAGVAVAAFEAGDYFSLALDSNGKLYSWDIMLTDNWAMGQPQPVRHPFK